MNELLQLALSQRRIKEILNVVFVGSIASFLFERLFFEYSVLELTDFRSLYSFFVEGHFIIPFTLFYCIWILTIGIRLLLFQVPNFFITRKFGDWLRKFLIAYYNGETIFNSKDLELPQSKSLKYMVTTMSAGEHTKKNLLKKTVQSHRNLESDFTLIFRGVIAVTIYFVNLKYFGWFTYVICIAILLCMWVVLIVNYQLAEVTPDVINANIEKLDTPKSS